MCKETSKMKTDENRHNFKQIGIQVYITKNPPNHIKKEKSEKMNKED